MHQIIRAIVYAKDQDEAVQEARKVFERLSDGGDPFDYFVLFNEDGNGVAGSDRWGKIPAVVKADSPEGKRLIDEGMKYTMQEAERSLSRIRYALQKYSDEELLSSKELKDYDEGWLDFLYECYCLGMRVGYKVYLYDNDGEGVKDYKTLYNVLHKGEDNKVYKDLDVWVVPADVHS